LREILALPEDERQTRGLLDTPREIAQQPEAWKRTAEVVLDNLDLLQDFLQQHLVFTGAGTSHFIGLSLMGLFRRRGFVAEAIPSTEITIDVAGVLPPVGFGMVSFARSGNSPEGNYAFELVSRRPDVQHLVVTCNPDGTLFELAGGLPGAARLLLPPMTNDRGLAMTSSYTSMVIAGQGLALSDLPDLYEENVRRMARMAERVLEDYPDALAAVAARRPSRVLFLGTGTLQGAATEAHLKVQELTAGKVVAQAESFLGLRHGPMALIDENTVVVAFLSSGPKRRQYEVDLLAELRAKGLGAYTVAVADNAEGLSDLADLVVTLDPRAAEPLLDDLRPPVYVVVAQLLALFLSLEVGLTPDRPSAGVINRVVQGVTIYPD
jgi:tagatose-6-phosphate ketose/aldose isomerase